MNERGIEDLKKIILDCLYLAQISELLNMNLITEDEYNKIKKTLKSF